MGTLINLAARLTGVKAVFDKINGYKTYIGGCIEILTGVGGVSLALAQALHEVVALTSPAEWLAWFQAAYAGSDPAIIALFAGCTLVGKGFVDIGLAHKNDKLMAAINANAQAAPNNAVAVPAPVPAAPVDPALHSAGLTGADDPNAGGQR